ncbi:hypothetical protein ES705_42019 [subsurface metagenome]
MKGYAYMSQIHGIITQEVNDMAKDKFAQWLNMNPVTQTGNDVLTHSETIIPTSPEEGKVIAIHAVDFMCGMLTAVDACWVMPVIATRPGLGLGDLVPGSPYLVAWTEQEMRFNTDGMSAFDVQRMLTYPVPFLVAHQKLYLYATSAVTGEAQVMRARILFTFEKVSTEEFFQALAQFGA